LTLYGLPIQRSGRPASLQKRRKNNDIESQTTAFIGVFTCLMISMVILFSAATPALAVEKVKVVSAWAQNNKMNDALWMLQKKVKEKSNGQLEITWGGGPEAIPAFQLVEALRNGVGIWRGQPTLQCGSTSGRRGAKLSKLTPAQERKVCCLLPGRVSEETQRLLPREGLRA
jgi:hypothetical protein